MRRISKEITQRVEWAVRNHANALLVYFTRRVNPHHEAADLLAETFLVVWRRASVMPQADSEAKLWMFGIARNVLLHHYRRKSKQRTITATLTSMLSTHAPVGFERDQEFDALYLALEVLDERDRDIIGLVHWDGFSLVEVSSILSMKEGTVRSRYHRAREKLRAALDAVSSKTPETICVE